MQPFEDISGEDAAALDALLDELPDQLEELEIPEDAQFPEPATPEFTRFESGPSYRRWVLLTLDHVEKDGREMSFDEAVRRVCDVFSVARYVAAREDHSAGGYHYHLALELNDFSRKNGTRKMRSAFPEYDGRAVNCSIHRGWNTMNIYVLKDLEKSPADYFQAGGADGYDLGMAVEEKKAKKNKKARATAAVRAAAKTNRSFASLVEDDDVASHMMTNFNAAQSFYNLCAAHYNDKTSKEMLMEKALEYQGEVPEGLFTAEQEASLDCWMQQLFEGRRSRMPQLYNYGASGTGKSYLFHILASMTRCFMPCLENGERAFAGYSDEQHDWIFIDEFHDNLKFSVFSQILAGDPMQINCYGFQRMKTKNVPVIVTANEMPSYKNLAASRVHALQTRLAFVKHETVLLDTDRSDITPQMLAKYVCKRMKYI
jgi:hypothetical protein